MHRLRQVQPVSRIAPPPPIVTPPPTPCTPTEEFHSGEDAIGNWAKLHLSQHVCVRACVCVYIMKLGQASFIAACVCACVRVCIHNEIGASSIYMGRKHIIAPRVSAVVSQHVCVCACVCVYIHTYIHTYIHIIFKYICGWGRRH